MQSTFRPALVLFGALTLICCVLYPLAVTGIGQVAFPSQAGGSDSKTTFQGDDLVRVHVQARFQCRVPFVNRMVCGAKTSMRTITAEAAGQ